MSESDRYNMAAAAVQATIDKVLAAGAELASLLATLKDKSDALDAARHELLSKTEES